MSRRSYAIVVSLAVLVGIFLRLPTLEVGFFLDDYAQLAMLQGTYPVPRHPLDLFDFSTGDPAEVRALVDSGYFPWWTHPELKLSLFRPLSSALIWLDWTLFGHDARAYHLHSMAWWIALVALFAGFAATRVPRPIAALAVWFFALDEAHSTLVGWIANRNALVSGVFGLLALWSHVRWRETGDARRIPVTVIAASLALLAGEYALCITGYGLAYELVVTRGRPLRERLGATVPLLGPSLGVLGLHLALGYGSYGSDLYIDPFRERAAFLGSLLLRIPVFVADLLLAIRGEWWITGPPLRDMILREGGFSAETWRALPSWHHVHVGLGCLGILLAIALVRRALEDPDPAVREAATWLSSGSLLALVPVAVALPTSRLMIVPLFGFALTLAIVVARATDSAWRHLRARRLPPLGASLVATLLAYLHLVVAPSHAAFDAMVLAVAANGVRTAVLEADLDPARVADQHVLVLATRDPQVAIYVCMIRRFHGAPTPKTCRTMSMAHAPHRVRRIDDRTLEVQALGGTMLSHLFERTFRTAAFPVEEGERFPLPGVTVEIVRTATGGARTVRFVFDEPLEADAFAFLRSTSHALEVFIPPAVGETERLPIAPPPIGPRPPAPPPSPASPGERLEDTTGKDTAAGSRDSGEPTEGEEDQRIDAGRDHE